MSKRKKLSNTKKPTAKEQANWDNYWREAEFPHRNVPAHDWREKCGVQVYRDGNGNLVIDDGDDIDLLGL